MSEQSNIIRGKAFTLYVTILDSISDISYDPPCLSGDIAEYRARLTPEQFGE